MYMLCPFAHWPTWNLMSPKAFCPNIHLRMLPDYNQWGLINAAFFFWRKLLLGHGGERMRNQYSQHCKNYTSWLTCNYQISHWFTLTLLNKIDYLLCKITEGLAIYIQSGALLQAHKLWKCSEKWIINNIYTSCEVEAIRSVIKLDLANAYWNDITDKGQLSTTMRS